MTPTPESAELLALADKIESLGFVGSDDLTEEEIQMVVASLRTSAPVPSPDGARVVVQDSFDMIRQAAKDRGYGVSPNSAPVFKASHQSRMSAPDERDPSVMPDCAGAETNALPLSKCWHGNSNWRMCHLCNPD